ncbi:hypothetical protein P691DRAFT_675030 [Macrolepiota fuliginosa MF-IS2]|uniref:Uncharacterized protein n=1 Tax=Macrolepiota fuliginosa MF-IS2 TaxID=1400762 RepID=A0A9P6BZ17_9AGAR|nr:hypothetical protein P691DRAFT_675030 [Macrolepiota fuliginosa MF-IS2]
MNFLRGNQSQDEGEKKQSGGGGLVGKVTDTLGGTTESKEDPLDKGIDFVQQNVLHQGPQDNESMIEQAKDKQIADAIRRGYKSGTGKEFPIGDK